MKKILLFTILFIGTLVCSFAERPTFYVDGTISFPISWNTDPEDANFKYIRQNSFAVGASSRIMFTNVIGLYLGADIYFPFSEYYKGKYESYKYTKSDFDYDEWYGYNILFAPSIMPINTDRFAFTIAPGFFLSTENISYVGPVTSGDTTYAVSADATKSSMGIGFNISADFYVTRNLYLKLGTDFAYMFYYVTDICIKDQMTNIKTKKSEEDSCKEVSIKPLFGVGVRL